MRPGSRHPTATAAAAVFVLALLLRLWFWSEFAGSALDRWHEWGETDMATFVEQSRRIAETDWLATDPYHPYHQWQQVAPPERWLAWYGPHAFHAAPGYSYLLALARSVSDHPFALVKWLQLALGAGTAALALLLGTALGGRGAGIAAGLLAAGYGPLFYLEPQLLREGPALFALLALLLLLHRCVDGPASAWRGPLALGVLLGLFTIYHEQGSVVAAVALLALVVRRWRAGRAAVARGAGALLGGALLGFLPWLARNLAVGAAPFSVSCRPTVIFVQANEANAYAGGALFSPPSPTAMQILDQAHGSFAAAVAGVWSSYGGDVGRMLHNWWQRLLPIWHAYEEADNTSFYLYRNLTSAMRLLPDFRWLFPLGFAGAAFALGAALRRRGRSGADADPAADSRGRGLRVLAAYLAAAVLALSLVHTVARYRLVLLPFFWTHAGIALALAVAAVRARQWPRLLALGGLALLGMLLQHGATRADAQPAPRPIDYAIAANMAVQDGDDDLLLRIAEDAAVHEPGNPNYYAQLGQRMQQRGDDEGAIFYYRRALERRAVPALQRDLDALLQKRRGR